MTARRQAPERRQAERRREIIPTWTFDKRFSINTIVSIAGMAIVVGGPVLVWGRAMEGRVQVLEIAANEKSKMESSRDIDTREARVSMAARLDKVDDKLNAMQVQVGQLVVQLGLAKGSR